MIPIYKTPSKGADHATSMFSIYNEYDKHC